MAVKSLRFSLFFLLLTLNSMVNALESNAGDSKARDSKITVAVASNFLSTMKQLVNTYQNATGRVVHLSGGSTGKHYAQILHGAPFDLFFAADELRPKLLEDKNIGIQDSRFTYAQGALVVWSPEIPKSTTSKLPLLDKKLLLALITSNRVKTFAMANPKLAPYGMAAQDALEILLPGGMSYLNDQKVRVIKGENISQTFQFIMSGSADIAFIAQSQMLSSQAGNEQKQGDNKRSGNYRMIPSALYRPIRQQAIRLNKKESARMFTDFVKSKAAKSIIERNGYTVPGAIDAG